jgi:hypothetical protein
MLDRASLYGIVLYVNGETAPIADIEQLFD